MPTIYCDHNFLIAAHDADVGYQADLRSLKDTDVTLVLSPWHWLEMARDPDKERGLSVARFADSLEPMWLLDRISLHTRELLIGLFLMTLIPQQISAPITTLEEVASDLNRGAPAHNFGGSAEFVTHMQGIGNEHPLERAIRENYHNQARNRADYRRGKIATLPNLDKLHARRLMERTGVFDHIPNEIKERFLRSYSSANYPSIALEIALTQDGWRQNRAMNDHNFRDLQHTMAIPYVDIFVTNDEKIVNMLNRVMAHLAFEPAQIMDSTAFHATYL